MAQYDFLNTTSYKLFRDNFLSDNNDENDLGLINQDYNKPMIDRKYNSNNNIFSNPVNGMSPSEQLNIPENESGFNVNQFLSGGTGYGFNASEFLKKGIQSSEVNVPRTQTYKSSFSGNQNPSSAFDNMYKYQDIDSNGELLSGEGSGGGSSTGAQIANSAGSIAGFVGNQAKMWSTDDGDLSEAGHFMKNLQSGGEGAATGAQVGGGIGAIVGAVIGLGSGIVDSIQDRRKARRRRREEYFDNVNKLETEREREERLMSDRDEINRLKTLRAAQLGYIQNENNYG